MSKTFGRKSWGEKKILPSFFIDFFIALLAVSVHEEPKNTTNRCSKIRPENLKKSQKR
jgi:hypothetical protein